MIDLIKTYKNNINALESNPLSKVLRFMLECTDDYHAIYCEDSFLGKAATEFHVKVYLLVYEYANKGDMLFCFDIWKDNTINAKIKVDEWLGFYNNRILGQNFFYKSHLYVFKNIRYTTYEKNNEYINCLSYDIIKYNLPLKEKNHE